MGGLVEEGGFQEEWTRAGGVNHLGWFGGSDWSLLLCVSATLKSLVY